MAVDISYDSTGPKPVADEAKRRIHAALKKTLEEELAKEGHTLGQGPGRPAGKAETSVHWIRAV